MRAQNRAVCQMRQVPAANIFRPTQRCTCARLVYFQIVHDALRSLNLIEPNKLLSLIELIMRAAVCFQKV
jgi:hypothetical protein